MENVRAERRRRVRWLLAVAALAAGLWFAWDAVSYATSLRVYMIPTGSMSPTLTPGDRIVTSSRPGELPKRGELWVFEMPNGGIALKRVVGLPGEAVEVSGGRVRIDGEPLPEPYLAKPMAYAMPPVHLKRGEYFMLGDNRNVSNDSHLWGPVPEGRFLGRADYRCWPTRRIGGLK